MNQFPLDELWLVDIDEERLKVVGGFAQRIVEAKGAPFKVTTSTNQCQFIENANFVTTQLRVEHTKARGRDEYLGVQHRLFGQQTTNVVDWLPATSSARRKLTTKEVNRFSNSYPYFSISVKSEF